MMNPTNGLWKWRVSATGGLSCYLCSGPLVHNWSVLLWYWLSLTKRLDTEEILLFKLKKKKENPQNLSFSWNLKIHFLIFVTGL